MRIYKGSLGKLGDKATKTKISEICKHNREALKCHESYILNIVDNNREKCNIKKEFKNENEKVCYYCKKSITNEKELTVDHLIPLSRGGKDDKTNMVISCRKCNFEKGDLTEEEYIRFNEDYESFEVKKAINDLLELYESIVEKSTKINKEYVELEKSIVDLEKKIMNSKFSASEGYKLVISFREALIKKNNLEKLRQAYNALHSCVGSSKKALLKVEENIRSNIFRDYYSQIKEELEKKHKIE